MPMVLGLEFEAKGRTPPSTNPKHYFLNAAPYHRPAGLSQLGGKALRGRALSDPA